MRFCFRPISYLGIWKAIPPFEMLSRLTTPAISWLYPPRSLLRPLAVEIVEREEEWMSMLSVFFNFGASFSSLSLFIGSRCGYSLDPGRFERKPNSRTRLLHYVCAMGLVLWRLYALYIYRNWVSPSSLFSRRGGRRAGWHQFHFFFFSFRFFSPSFHILFFSRHLNLDVAALVASFLIRGTWKPKPCFLVRLSLASRRCIQKAARRS